MVIWEAPTVHFETPRRAARAARTKSWDDDPCPSGCFFKSGVLIVGVLIIRALCCLGSLRAPDFWNLKTRAWMPVEDTSTPFPEGPSTQCLGCLAVWLQTPCSSWSLGNRDLNYPWTLWVSRKIERLVCAGCCDQQHPRTNPKNTPNTTTNSQRNACNTGRLECLGNFSTGQSVR